MYTLFWVLKALYMGGGGIIITTMISEESCDTEDWSNGAQYSALPSQE